MVAKGENASRRMDKTDEQMIWMGRKGRRQTRNEKNQARMWLVLVKMLAAFSWTESRLNDIAVRHELFFLSMAYEYNAFLATDFHFLRGDGIEESPPWC